MQVYVINAMRFVRGKNSICLVELVKELMLLNCGAGRLLDCKEIKPVNSKGN